MALWQLRLLFVLLLTSAVVSAFAVISSTHRSRALYTQLQGLEGQHWYLEEEYSRLLLEQSTWASHHRIESEAGRLLGLGAPDHEHLRLVPR